MLGKNVFFGILVTTMIFWTARADAKIVINEFLADPGVGLLGDANNDGTGSTTSDEFVELLNFGNDATDISGWYLSDALNPRHTFPDGSVLLPNEFLVVFSGGNPNLADTKWQLASTGSLSLNNATETVTLYDLQNQMADQVSYGSEGGRDQSLTRWPEGEGTTFALHSSLPESQGRFYSPGTLVNGQQFETPVVMPPSGAEDDSQVVTPELNSLFYLGMGILMFFRRLFPGFMKI